MFFVSFRLRVAIYTILIYYLFIQCRHVLAYVFCNTSFLSLVRLIYAPELFSPHFLLLNTPLS